MHLDLSIHVGLLVGLPESAQTGAAASHEIARTHASFLDRFLSRSYERSGSLGALRNFPYIKGLEILYRLYYFGRKFAQKIVITTQIIHSTTVVLRPDHLDPSVLGRELRSAFIRVNPWLLLVFGAFRTMRGCC